MVGDTHTRENGHSQASRDTHAQAGLSINEFDVHWNEASKTNGFWRLQGLFGSFERRKGAMIPTTFSFAASSSSQIVEKVGVETFIVINFPR